MEILRRPSSVPFRHAISGRICSVLPLVVQVIRVGVRLVLPSVRKNASVATAHPSGATVTIRNRVRATRSSFSYASVGRPKTSHHVITYKELNCRICLVDVDYEDEFRRARRFVSQGVDELTVRRGHHATLSIRRSVAVKVCRSSQRKDGGVVGASHALDS